MTIREIRKNQGKWTIDSLERFYTEEGLSSPFVAVLYNLGLDDKPLNSVISDKQAHMIDALVEMELEPQITIGGDWFDATGLRRAA